MLSSRSKPSPAAPASLFYITTGALMTVWSGIFFLYLQHYPPTQHWPSYLCAGFFVTGIVLLVIGLAVGPLARLAKHAELPPKGAEAPESQNHTTAAANRAG